MLVVATFIISAIQSMWLTDAFDPVTFSIQAFGRHSESCEIASHSNLWLSDDVERPLINAADPT